MRLFHVQFFFCFVFRMTTLDHANHSIRRKSYAPHYTPNNVAQFQAEMHEYSFELINVSIWSDFFSILTVFQDFGKHFWKNRR